MTGAGCAKKNSCDSTRLIGNFSKEMGIAKGFKKGCGGFYLEVREFASSICAEI